MREIGGDRVTSQALVDTLRTAHDHPSFAGHDYTCDGTPIPEMPSLCAPQQIIAHYDGDEFSQASDGWIDVPALVAGLDPRPPAAPGRGEAGVDEYLRFLLLGLGSGAVVAVLGLGLVLTQRASGVINFAHTAMGMYVAATYFQFRETGDLVLPLIGLPSRVHLLARPTLATALVFALVLAAAVGLAVYLLVFRPLRQAPALAKVAASLGLLLYIQEMVRLRFPSGSGGEGASPDPARRPGAGPRHDRDAEPPDARRADARSHRPAQRRVPVHPLRPGERPAADSEKGALLLGISPDRLGSGSWALASMLAGVAVILVEPITGVGTTTTLLVVPALAAALLGRLDSFVDGRRRRPGHRHDPIPDAARDDHEHVDPRLAADHRPAAGGPGDHPAGPRVAGDASRRSRRTNRRAPTVTAPHPRGRMDRWARRPGARGLLTFGATVVRPSS